MPDGSGSHRNSGGSLRGRSERAYYPDNRADEPGAGCGSQGQHRDKPQGILFVDFSLQRTCRDHQCELADQGGHEVPDREEDRDCHQCHNGQFSTVVGHRVFPHERRRTARRRSS